MKMRVLSLALVVGCSLSPTLAQAFGWNGFYGGLLLGGAGGNNDATLWADYGDGTYYPRNNVDSIDTSGWMGGATLGANFQSSQFVVGLEGDLSAANLTGSDADEFDCGDDVCTNENGLKTHFSGLATFRARAGVALDNLLFYATAGVGVARFTDFITGDSISGDHVEYGRDFTRTALIAGAGVEFALSENITAKAEYLYSDFGNTSFDVNDVSNGEWFGDGSEAYTDIGHKLQIARVGLNLHF